MRIALAARLLTERLSEGPGPFLPGGGASAAGAAGRAGRGQWLPSVGAGGPQGWGEGPGDRLGFHILLWTLSGRDPGCTCPPQSPTSPPGRGTRPHWGRENEGVRTDNRGSTCPPSARAVSTATPPVPKERVLTPPAVTLPSPRGVHPHSGPRDTAGLRSVSTPRCPLALRGHRPPCCPL